MNPAMCPVAHVGLETGRCCAASAVAFRLANSISVNRSGVN